MDLQWYVSVDWGKTKLESLSTISATTATNSGMNPYHPSDCDILASLPGVGLIVLVTSLGEAGGAIRNRAFMPLCGV